MLIEKLSRAGRQLLKPNTRHARCYVIEYQDVLAVRRLELPVLVKEYRKCVPHLDDEIARIRFKDAVCVILLGGHDPAVLVGDVIAARGLLIAAAGGSPL